MGSENALGGSSHAGEDAGNDELHAQQQDGGSDSVDDGDFLAHDNSPFILSPGIRLPRCARGRPAWRWTENISSGRARSG